MTKSIFIRFIYLKYIYLYEYTHEVLLLLLVPDH